MYLNPLGSSTLSANYYSDLYNSTSSTRNTQDTSSSQSTGLLSTPAGNVSSAASAAQSAESSSSSSSVSSLLTRESGFANDPSNFASLQPVQNLLTSVVSQAIEAENPSPSSMYAGMTVSFDSMEYSVYSNVAASVNQQGQQVNSDQYAAENVLIRGSGEATFSDGTVKAFDVEILAGQQSEVSASQSFSASAASSTISASSTTTTDESSTDGSASSTSDLSSVTSNYLAQLVQAMGQTGAPTVVDHPGSSYRVATVSIGPPQTGGQSAQTSEPSPKDVATIDWDAIQQQTATLIDLLNAAASGDQGASTSGAASGSVTPGSGTSGGSSTTDGISKAVGNLMTKVITASETNATPATANAQTTAIADSTT